MCNGKKRIENAIIVFSVLCSVCAQDFGYDGSDGPKHWGEKYHQCVGKHQSPIDIEEHNVEIVNLYPMVFENFNETAESVDLKNNGHTAQVTIKTNKKPQISGGPLVGKYEFIQLHFHWGSNDHEGSENKINNNSFPMEIHLVFYRSAYGSFQEAIEHPDGLAVLSFLYSKSPKPNKNYDPLIKATANVQAPGTTTPVIKFPSFDDLLISNRSVYYTYGGSLTTPPCSEVVTWIEYKNTIPMAHEQIEMFRHLKGEHGLMSHNFRPVQPLHGRIIRMNQGILPPLDQLLREMKNNARPQLCVQNYLTLLVLLVTLFI